MYRACGSTDTPICNINAEKFYSVFSAWQQLLIDEKYTPTVVFDKSGKPIDYSYMDITYLGADVDKRHYPDLSSMLDTYFEEKDRLEHIHQRSRDITTLLNNAQARTERKLAIQRQSLLDADKGDEYKKHADLITANLYRLERGMTSFVTTDYYDESCPEIEIKLDSRLSPSQNAQKLYKLYNKCKTAKTVLAEQIKLWEGELRYLESVRQFLSRAECEQDVIEIREELYRSGYASRMKGYVSSKKHTSTPHKFKTSGGYELLVGRNNLQNDRLTFKVAGKGDLWFHTKDIPGSHVIMLCNGEEPGELDYTQAASVAARYSKATADLVAVDYTRVKNIKKPQGSKPGFVTYKTNYTAFVRPATDKEIEEMKK